MIKIKNPGLTAGVFLKRDIANPINGALWHPPGIMRAPMTAAKTRHLSKISSKPLVGQERIFSFLFRV
jgi:hypothetical protein